MNNHNGFTLIELMVVITIVGVLSAVALPKFSDIIAKAHFTKATTVVTQLYTAQTIYEMEDAAFAYPTNNNEFIAFLDVDVEQRAHNFNITITNVDNGNNYSLKAEVKTGIGSSLAGEYFQVDRDFNKRYKGAALYGYAPNFLTGAIED